MSDIPDFDEFQSLLLDATRSAFTFVQHEHSNESFYAFSLFHEPLWAYIIPTSNTEEGLIRRAEHYKLDIYKHGYAKQSIEELAQSLRWNPADCAYHDVDNKYFDPVDQWLNHYDIYGRYHDETINPKMIEVCRNVLRTLDAESIFGTESTRTKITISIMMGDQDSTWLEHAQLLNPPIVYKRWVEELKTANLY